MGEIKQISDYLGLIGSQVCIDTTSPSRPAGFVGVVPVFHSYTGVVHDLSVDCRFLILRNLVDQPSVNDNDAPGVIKTGGKVAIPLKSISMIDVLQKHAD